MPKWSQNGAKIQFSGTYFSITMPKHKSVFGLRRCGRNAYEPIPWSAQGDSKFEEKRTANKTCLESSRLHATREKYDSHWGQDGRQGGDVFWLFLPGCLHGRPQGCKDLKNLLLVHRITKMWPPELQKWAQEYPKWNLNLKSEPKSWWGAFL